MHHHGVTEKSQMRRRKARTKIRSRRKCFQRNKSRLTERKLRSPNISNAKHCLYLHKAIGTSLQTTNNGNIQRMRTLGLDILVRKPPFSHLYGTKYPAKCKHPTPKNSGNIIEDFLDNSSP